jgi:uncharacterized membrane protein YdjX (TVP38/TMEM64 family)
VSPLEGAPPLAAPRAAKIATAAIAVAIGVVAQRLGAFELASDPARLKQALVDLGPSGYAAFLAAYTVIQPLGLPGTVFVVAAALIWPWPVAFALSMTGSLSASVVGFSFARFVARDGVARWVPARFHRYDEALAQRAFATVFVLRSIFWMSPLLNLFLGLSKVRFSTHFWATVAAYALPLLALCYFGPEALEALRAAPLWAWIALGAGTIAIVAVVWAFRRRAARVLCSYPAGSAPPHRPAS